MPYATMPTFSHNNPRGAQMVRSTKEKCRDHLSNAGKIQITGDHSLQRETSLGGASYFLILIDEGESVNYCSFFCKKHFEFKNL